MYTEKSHLRDGYADKTTLPAGMTAALDTSQASLYTGLAASTLEKKRVTGGGPKFVRYGRKAVRYLVADLDNWMANYTVSSTSQSIAIDT